MTSTFRHTFSMDAPSEAGSRAITPTDISQFIRLDQCQRYLRLRLYERANGRDFMEEYGVAAQSIPPILTRSGADFEEQIARDIDQYFAIVEFSEAQRSANGNTTDNRAIAGIARAIQPGEVIVCFQPRLQANLHGWRIRGDVDILQLERTSDDTLTILIADMKASTASKVEHRLQVAFYHEILTDILRAEEIPHDAIELAILYRGPAATDDGAPDEDDLLEAQRDLAFEFFGTRAGLLERIDGTAAYIGAVHDLVLGDRSTASRVIQTTFEELPFHLGYKCDGCLFNEFCMKQSAETDDLSLLPHISEQDKSVLRREGITTVRELATLKDLHKKGQVQIDGEVQENTVLVPAAGNESLSRKLAATWPVGPHLDELIHRARRYRNWIKDPNDPIEALSYIPSKGYGSLPYSDATQNPNLIRIYIDVQHDYLNDRLYMAGALIVACEHGIERPHRRRSVVRLGSASPESSEHERELLVDWITDVLQTIADIAAPDAEGKPRAPIHLVFINAFAQRVLLDALGRHATSILGATALYDFVTQLAAFDSPLLSFLDQQVKDHKNYPMVCQSLQAVAAYLRFDWNAGTPYREIFRARLFDFWGKLGDEDSPQGWYTNRARFNSQIPLEFAYAAWGDLPPAVDGRNDEMAPYRDVTPDLLVGFHARRLDAMECIAQDFAGNRQTTQSVFDLPDLAHFTVKAPTFAHALDEFVTIERHVELAGWKSARLAPPEERVLAGQTFIVRYVESDQAPDMLARYRENERRRLLEEQYRAEYREVHPDAKQVRLTPEQKADVERSIEGLVIRLRIETAGIACELDEALGLSTIKPGDRLVIASRTETDSRLPAAERVPFTPTPKQLLYRMRLTLDRIVVERDPGGRATVAFAGVSFPSFQGGTSARGYTFSGRIEPLVPDGIYTLDADPNDYYGSWTAKVTQGLVEGGENAVYAHIAGDDLPPVTWTSVSVAAQHRFLAGLDALETIGAMHGFEPSKREFIGEHGGSLLLLVQGPPGTGKSYSTAFAIFARIQGAMAADREFRVFLSCKTHAATDVLLENVRGIRQKLREIARDHPEIFGRFFDPRLLDVALFRVRPRGDLHRDVLAIPKDEELPKGSPKAPERILAERWCVIGSTPGGIYGIIKDRWDAKNLFGHVLADCLVLDEASQMSIPEAAMAALPLALDGRLIVVGDHRQMPPIVKNDWANESRRSFQEFRSYESLFLALLPLDPPMIRFEESFRLHADMAEFLRREIYQQDGINYHSRRHDLIPARIVADPFVAAALLPHYPLTVIVHDEHQSQVRNRFEQDLIAPILRELADADGYALDPGEGLGVVVPHRAQRAALQEGIPELTRIDPETGDILISAVDTVERFQGGERIVILIGATESDREYLLVSSKFLLDPRRLTVALSRAKRKLVLVAARSVFEVFSADEETFANAQLWKNLLRRTCTAPLWQGERDGIAVEVWGNRQPDQPHQPNGRPPRHLTPFDVHTPR